MSEPFLAEIRIVGFNFAPRGWAFCDGQILPINQNQSLYSLLGTTYGGDGRTSFALPDLRSRTATHPASSNGAGVKAGEENHVLALTEVPSHSHKAQATSATGASTAAANNLLGTTSGGRRPLVPYGSNTTPVALSSNAVSSTGGQGHDNMQPWLALNFCIALQGLFPSRN